MFREAIGLATVNGTARPESASYDADFLNSETETPELAPPPIVDSILETGQSREDLLDSVYNLQAYMQGLLANQTFRNRNQTANWYAEHYRQELDVDTENLNHDQRSALLMARLYFSSVSSVSQMRKFVQTGRQVRRFSKTRKRHGQRSARTEAAKVDYLKARKVYQDDVDDFLEHFDDEPRSKSNEVLKEVASLARLLINNRDFIDASLDDYSHVFVGSALSERAVKEALEARYCNENEERRPIRGDVAKHFRRLFRQRVMYVQVKMRWTKPTKFKVSKENNGLKVVMPMQALRADLDGPEYDRLHEVVKLHTTPFAIRALQTGVNRLRYAA